MLQWLHLFQPLEEPVVKPEQRGNQGMHICWTHQQFIHAGLAFFQVYSLYGDTLLSGDTEGCLHHSCGPAAWESWPQHSNDKVDRGEDSTHSWRSARTASLRRIPTFACSFCSPMCLCEVSILISHMCFFKHGWLFIWFLTNQTMQELQSRSCRGAMRRHRWLNSCQQQIREVEKAENLTRTEEPATDNCGPPSYQLQHHFTAHLHSARLAWGIFFYWF